MTTLSELRLSPTQISALVVLMAEARPIYNPDLIKLANIDLNGDQKKELVDNGLIISYRTGRGYTHELSELGWRKTRELLQIDEIGGTGPTRNALRVLMSALDRGLQERRLTPASFFYRDPDAAAESPADAEPPSDMEQAIRLAYKGIVAVPGDWVRLPKIRSAVAHASRDAVDAALARLAVQPDVRIIPIANLKSLSQEDRDAAIRLGGEMKHAIAIEG